MLLEALRRQLDITEPERVVLAAQGDPELVASAEALIGEYALGGVDPELTPVEAAEGVDDASLAEFTILTESLGLDAGLETELLATLQAMREDLDGLAGGGA